MIGERRRGRDGFPSGIVKAKDEAVELELQPRQPVPPSRSLGTVTRADNPGIEPVTIKLMEQYVPHVGPLGPSSRLGLHHRQRHQHRHRILFRLL